MRSMAIGVSIDSFSGGIEEKSNYIIELPNSRLVKRPFGGIIPCVQLVS
jgi:hypothetical protein